MLPTWAAIISIYFISWYMYVYIVVWFAHYRLFCYLAFCEKRTAWIYHTLIALLRTCSASGFLGGDHIDLKSLHWHLQSNFSGYVYVRLDLIASFASRQSTCIYTCRDTNKYHMFSPRFDRSSCTHSFVWGLNWPMAMLWLHIITRLCRCCSFLTPWLRRRRTRLIGCRTWCCWMPMPPTRAMPPTPSGTWIII